MYDFIFASKATTVVAAVSLLMLACVLAARAGFWWRALAVNLGPIIAPGFLVAVLLSDQRFATVDVLAALVLLFAILCIFCRLVYLSYHSLHAIAARDATRMLVVCTLLFVCTLLPVALSGGFGIFSAGTRIDYLYESSAAKYLTYGGLMLNVVLGGLLARRITLNRKPQLLDYVVILIVSAASVLAGSKGGFVLWLGSVLGMIDYRQARIRPQTIIMAVLVFVALLVTLAVVVSDFLRISIPEFFDLAFSRIFISNDGLALSFDLRSLEVQPSINPLSEAFRSLGNLFGYPPQNAPLGAEFYDRYFGPSGGAGANASLVGMIMFYTAPGYAVLPLLIASLATLPLFLMARTVWLHMPSAFTRYTMQTLAMLNFTLFSQDFLAVQVVFPMTVVLALIFYLSGSLHVLAIRRPRAFAR
jgi:hypothetical protein